MIVSEILRKERNNIDLFRFIAACSVIYGHAWALSGLSGHSDIVTRLIGFDYSGSLAVKLFFFLSGLVVTNSLLSKRSIASFVISRIFRIWPALLFVLFVTSFIFPFLVGGEGVHLSSNNFEYFYRNTLMDIQFDVPGVFDQNPQKAVNGSIWSLPYEVYAYAFLIAAFWVGLFKFRWFATCFFILICVDPLVGNHLFFSWLPTNPEVNLLAPCFAFGAIIAVWKDFVSVNLRICLGLWLLFFLFRNSYCNFYFFYTAFFMTVVLVSSSKLLVKFKPSSDYSYGIYLWGWPVQQICVVYFASYGVFFNQVFSLLSAIVMGIVSWHLVEKRCIALGSRLSSFCSSWRA